MTATAWYAQKVHFRHLRDQLAAEGFEVVRAWNGRHLRLRLQRGLRQVTVTVSGSPSVREHAIDNTLHQARRFFRCAATEPFEDLEATAGAVRALRNDDPVPVLPVGSQAGCKRTAAILEAPASVHRMAHEGLVLALAGKRS